MQYRLLGKTGLSVSLIGFGASPLGNVFSDVSTVEASEAVNKAIDGGINLFDVSPYYGATLAEKRLGDALDGRRSEVILATKCGRSGVAEFDFSTKGIRQSVEASLRRLKTDYVDLLQAHDIEFVSSSQILEEALPTMRDLQREGKARFIGLTGYWPGMLASIASRSDVDTILNYCHFNLFANDMDLKLVPLAKEKAIGLINASPLHMGLLGGGITPEWHPAPPQVRAAATALIGLCRQHGTTAASVGLRYCSEHPVAASTLIGIRTSEEIAAAFKAIATPLSPELRSSVQAILQPILNTSWRSGLRENEDVET